MHIIPIGPGYCIGFFDSFGGWLTCPKITASNCARTVPKTLLAFFGFTKLLPVVDAGAGYSIQFVRPVTLVTLFPIALYTGAQYFFLSFISLTRNKL